MIISIYQLKPRYEEFYKSSFDTIVNQIEQKPTRNMYRKIYMGEVDDEDGLDDIFGVLQREMPDDFLGHTFGVSDVVGIESNGKKLKEDSYYFCDNIGWQKLDWNEVNESYTSPTEQKNNLYFSTPTEFVLEDGMRKSQEGNHFWLSEKDAVDTLGDLQHKFVYSIYSGDLTKPFLVEGDLVLWDGENISCLLLAKLFNEPYDVWGDGKDIIQPDQIHIDNLQISDAKKIASIEDMDDVFDFLRSKGYDHIRYKNTQEHGTDSIILNHDSNFDFDSLRYIYQ